jgi:Fic family protein
MSDLIAFAQRVDLPVIFQMAVAHAQFETIHPFADGNGRTGRALIHVMLRQAGLVTGTVVPISAGLLTDTQTYFAALSAYRAGDAGPIVQQFSDASRFAATSGRELIDRLIGQLDEARELMRGLRTQATAWQVLPHLISHPVLNSSVLTRQLKLSDTAAQRALAQLTDAGVLVERSGGRRHRIWQHEGILGVLDEYAAGLRRR